MKKFNLTQTQLDQFTADVYNAHKDYESEASDLFDDGYFLEDAMLFATKLMTNTEEIEKEYGKSEDWPDGISGIKEMLTSDLMHDPTVRKAYSKAVRKIFDEQLERERATGTTQEEPKEEPEMEEVDVRVEYRAYSWAKISAPVGLSQEELERYVDEHTELLDIDWDSEEVDWDEGLERGVVINWNQTR